MLQELSRAGVVAIFGMVVGLIPLGVAAFYLVRPTDRLVGLMRPLTLATVFAALNTFLSGLAAMFRRLPLMKTPDGYNVDWITAGLSETITPMFVACGCLAAAWLCIAAGMRK